uniref:RxLR effector candidate protein n=1 Tax=Hyaloperonospora arabidopsidis (strain Emoy2) TaxID=559515 RepID=M4BXZ3_HYAAE
MMTSFLGIGVRASTVAALSLLKACTIRHPPEAFHAYTAPGLPRWEVRVLSSTPSHDRLLSDLQRIFRSLVLVHEAVDIASQHSTSNLVSRRFRDEYLCP